MKIQEVFFHHQTTNAICSIRQKQDTARGRRRFQSIKKVCVFFGVSAVVVIAGWVSYGSIAESTYSLYSMPTENMPAIDAWSLVALQFGK